MHMMRETPDTAEGAGSQEAIQALREVGTTKKTQYWSFEEIEAAIREANLLGIDPQKLFGTSTAGEDLAI